MYPQFQDVYMQVVEQSNSIILKRAKSSLSYMTFLIMVS